MNKIALLSASALCISLPAAAQDQDPGQPQEAGSPRTGATEEIIVTARKRSERLIDVPETIQAVTSETLQAAGIANINDLGRITPGTVLNRGNDNEPNIVIRGVGAFGNTQGVGFYIDDVQNFTDQSPNMGDVERIEILKGPQGTLYGGSNIGGAVKYVMKAPGDSLRAEGKIDLGEYRTFNVFGAIGGPLDSAGTFGARVSAYHNRFGGFIPNVNIGGYADKSRETGVRVALAWDPSEDLSFQLSYRHSSLKNGGNIWLRPDNVNDFDRFVEFNAPVYNDRKVNGVILQSSYRPGDVAITSVSSYTQRNNKWFWDADYSAAEAVLADQGRGRVGRVFTQELRIASDTGSDFDWIVGGYFANVKNRVLTNTADLYLGPDHPFYQFINPGGTGYVLALPDFNNADVNERQYAAFATANYRFGGFRVGGGLRLNRSEYTGRRLNEGLTLINNETKLLPKVTLAYDFGDTMIYGNFAIGAEPGRANVLGDFSELYKAEVVTNYELGIKGQTPDRRFTYELAVFYIDSKDRQQENQVADATGTAIETIINAGDSRTYGVEGNFSWRPVTGLTLSAGGAWLDARWRNGVTAAPDPANPGQVINLPLRDRFVPNSPRFTGNASLDWRMPVSAEVEIGFRADWSRSGSFYADLRNRGYQKAYDIVNVSVFAGQLGNRWNLTFRVENLLDTRYFDDLNYGFDDEPDANGNCNACSLGQLGSPRRALASLSFNL